MLTTVPKRIEHLRIPFLSTKPTTDLKLLFLLLPVWWVLGIEQFIWLPILSWSVVKLLLIRRRVRYQSTLIIAIAFLLVSLISVITIDEPIRYLTFSRNLLSYFTALLLFFVVTNASDNWDELKSILDAAIISLALIGVFGLIAATGIYAPTVVTPIAALLPEIVSGTDLGSRLTTRELGANSWFSYFGRYYRLRGTFLYATMYAASLAMTIPLAFLCLNFSRKRYRLLYLLAIVILTLNLILTTGRMAWAVLLSGSIVFLLSNRNFSLPLRSSFALVGMILVVLTLGLNGAEVGENVNQLLNARGSSTSDRLKIYRTTVQEMWQQPFIGFGTERDLPNLPYPAGSHSYFLGTLYRHGFPAFLLFVGIWISIWVTSRRRTPSSAVAMNYLRWSLLVATFISFTEVLDLDTSSLMFMWLVLSAVQAASTLPRSERGGRGTSRQAANLHSAL